MTAVAAVQMASGDAVAPNLRTAAAWLQRAADAGARLAVLPENFACFDVGRLPVAERDALAGTALDWLAGQAQSLGLWIVGGSLPEPVGDGKYHSLCAVIDAEGRCVARYRKCHLFDVDVADAHGRYRESDRFHPGDAVTVLDSPVGRLGLAVCYDLRFPELFRAMSAQGAEVFCVPSAFTAVTGGAHWWPLLRARAIENLAYVVAANQGGWHSRRRETFGHSTVIDPWGRVLAEHDRGEGLAVADVDRAVLQRCRRQLPALQHRRF